VSAFEVPLTRREAVVQRLRQEIASGELAPGTLLKDAELSARLGVSLSKITTMPTRVLASDDRTASVPIAASRRCLRRGCLGGLGRSRRLDSARR
jgi:DNA-binding transcriptional MocR family regulator